LFKIVLLNRFHDWPDGVERTYPCLTLRRNTWNDYGYETLFNTATIRLSDDERFELGSVKIGRFGYTTDDPSMRSALPVELPALGGEYFSLGQDVDYYERLGKLDPELRKQYAVAMRDIPILGLPIAELEKEEVFRVSLLRDSSARQALDEIYTLFGHVKEPVEAFTFRTQLDGAAGPHEIPFDFKEQGGLPHRINILVGVNGVGKTQVMARLALLMSGFQEEAKAEALRVEGKTSEALGSLSPQPSLYGVIAVSFSAFDDFELPGKPASEPAAGEQLPAEPAANADGPDPQDDPAPKFHYVYCGLREAGGTISQEAGLATRIPDVVQKMSAAQRLLLQQAIAEVLPAQNTPDGAIDSIAFYRRLSAGQRIVLNIICDLILHIRKRSLILLDEPETHLHPQLLTTLLSLVNDLLVANDSFAVIATHSPIVVQQVLAKRVHKIRRVDGDIPQVASPEIETFGENLTEIVRSVFDALESDRDYEEVIDRLLERHGRNADQVLALFEGRLGLNAQIYLRSRGVEA
jgi:hypothetical protein